MTTNEAEEHVQLLKAEGRVTVSRHLAEDHGATYGPEWRQRVPHGYGYEFSEWHRELHGLE